MNKKIIIGILIAVIFISGCIELQKGQTTFIIKNDFSIPIYLQWDSIEKERASLSIYYFENNQWNYLDLYSTCECGEPCTEVTPLFGIFDINAKDTINISWDGHYYQWNSISKCYQKIIAKSGKYKAKICYSLNYTFANWTTLESYPNVKLKARLDTKTCIEKEFEVTGGNQTIVIDIKRDIKFGQVYGIRHNPEEDLCAQRLELLAKAAIYLNEECVASSGSYVKGELKFIFKDENGNIVGTKTIIDPKQENRCITEKFSINESDLSVNITEVKTVTAFLTYNNITIESKEFDTMLQGLCEYT